MSCLPLIMTTTSGRPSNIQFASESGSESEYSPGKELVQQTHQFLGGALIREAGETADVRKKDAGKGKRNRGIVSCRTNQEKQKATRIVFRFSDRSKAAILATTRGFFFGFSYPI